MTGPGFTQPAGRPCNGSTCDAMIWPVTVYSSGRIMWCDAGSLGAPAGNVAVWWGERNGQEKLLARVVSAGRPLGEHPGERLAVAHWATCADTAEFRKAPGPVHQCPGPGRDGTPGACPIMNVPEDKLACAAHWAQVPRPYQRAVSQTWRRGAGKLSAAHAAACAAAIDRMRPL